MPMSTLLIQLWELHVSVRHQVKVGVLAVICRWGSVGHMTSGWGASLQLATLAIGIGAVSGKISHFGLRLTS